MRVKLGQTVATIFLKNNQGKITQKIRVKSQLVLNRCKNSNILIK